MNAREKRLLVVLLVILGGGGAGIIVYSWFCKPLWAYNTQITGLNRDIEDRELQILVTRSERKLLDRARMMSLSPNIDGALAEYGKFLSPLLIDSGLEIEEFRPAETAEVRQPTQPGVLKPSHRFVTFQIRAKGELPQLVYMIENMQKTPLVHRLKTVSIERVDKTAKSKTDRLNIGLKIEAMIVGKAEPHIDGPLLPDQRLVAMEVLLALRRGPTGLALLPWVVGPTGPFARQALAMESGYRQYNDMERKNIFRGGERPPPPEKVVEEDESEFKPFADVVEYIRLDTTDPDNREAYFRNLVFKMRPIRVRASTFSTGYSTFKIYDSEGKTHALFTGKILRVEQRDVYFQVMDDVYAVHLGQSLGDAMRRPLLESQMERLDLTRLFDKEWAAKERKEHEASAKLTAKKKRTRE